MHRSQVVPIFFESCNVPQGEQWANVTARLNAMDKGPKKEAKLQEHERRLEAVVAWFNGLNSEPAPGETAYTLPKTVPSYIRKMDLQRQVSEMLKHCVSLMSHCGNLISSSTPLRKS